MHLHCLIILPTTIVWNEKDFCREEVSGNFLKTTREKVKSYSKKLFSSLLSHGYISQPFVSECSILPTYQFKISSSLPWDSQALLLAPKFPMSHLLFQVLQDWIWRSQQVLGYCLPEIQKLKCISLKILLYVTFPLKKIFFGELFLEDFQDNWKEGKNLRCPQMRVGWCVRILQRSRTKNKQINKGRDVSWGIGSQDYEGWELPPCAVCKLETQESWWCNSSLSS